MGEFAAASPGPVLEDSPDVPEPPMTFSYTAPPMQNDAPRPLALAELVSPQPSSKGSVLHYQGTCKPCAFFWKVVGCKYGSECEFCHLCDADERKRRNKDKRIAMHAMQASSQVQCEASYRQTRSSSGRFASHI